MMIITENGAAQGIGIRLGPVLNNNIDLARKVGFSLGGDIYQTVDRDGFLGTTVHYTRFGLDRDAAAELFKSLDAPDQLEISGGGWTQWTIMGTARFRLHHHLYEPSLLLIGGIGATILTGDDITGKGPSYSRDLEIESVYAFAAMGGIGMDYPIIDENWALTAQLEAPINLIRLSAKQMVSVPTVALTVGIEFRTE